MEPSPSFISSFPEITARDNFCKLLKLYNNDHTSFSSDNMLFTSFWALTNTILNSQISTNSLSQEI